MSILGCSHDDTIENVTLEKLGVLGLWEVSAKGTNNVSSAETICCETLEFLDDAMSTDFKGNYIHDYAEITTGTFFIDVTNNELIFTTENENTFSLYFNIVMNTLEVWFFDEDNARVWTRYTKADDH